MTSAKEKIKNLLDQLPDEEPTAWDAQASRNFLELTEAVFQEQKRIFTPSYLAGLAEQEDPPYDFIMMMAKCGQSIQVFNEWLEENKETLQSPELEENIKGYIHDQTEELKSRTNTLQKVQAHIAQFITHNKELSNTLEKLRENEGRYRSLVAKKDEMESRRKELRELEAMVRTGRLKELEAEVQSMEKQIQEAESRWKDATEKRQAMLQRQKELEESTQQLIRQSAFIGNTEALFEKIKTECESHNKEAMEQFQASSEELKVRIQFNRDTSQALIGKSIEKMLAQAERLALQCEEEIKGMLKEQK